MKKYSLFIGILLCGMAWANWSVMAQTGDQMLDGIGETGLIARYTFKEDGKDWSRNNFHASFHGTGFKFVKDKLFGQVLEMPGTLDDYISLPAKMLEGQESLTITGWVYLESSESNQYFFDFGKDKSRHICFAPFGMDAGEEYQFIIKNAADSYHTGTKELSLNRWNHLAMVMDVPYKTIRVYVNGRLAGETKEVDISVSEIFDEDMGNANFLIGKAIAVSHKALHARIHDFRIYRIPLSARQIAGIHYFALKKDEPVVRTRRENNQDLPEFDKNSPQLYNAYLEYVPDIQVETPVGCLPHLPRLVRGVYRDGIEGPKVRVLWPAPEDNHQVQNPGSYTIIGEIPGTDIQSRALVVVKAEKNTGSPERSLEAFRLDQVLLNHDSYGNKTKFMENRDKFMMGLANTNPDHFLYMFRNAFGQEQPEGARPLGVWDSQETKLRGHATGHYLSAIAQAYASTIYDADLRANFAEKMEYMVNSLYELSRMSGRPAKPGGEFVSDPLAVPPGPGKSDYSSDLSEEGIRNDYWNWGVGFISAYPPDQFIMLEKGAKYGTDDTKIWAPYYTLHKILAGLMDVYELSGNEKALEIVKGMGDWVYARMSKLSTGTLISMWNRYIAGEFGGMNEAMARLFRLSDDPHYLEVAQKFDNIRVFFGDAEHSHGLAKNVDMFRGLHANQHIPQIMGALEIYRVTHNSDYYYITDNFWQKATGDYMYSIGGVAGARNPANAECFTCQPASLYENGFSAGGQNETCATYNMLKITRNLFLYDQRGELMDYYERGLYNHILASVAENSAANTYHVPLRAGSAKHFSNAGMDGFTCCNGTALESSTKLQNSIYFRSVDNQSLYVNLYVPSTLEWTEKNICIKQETAFPREDYTSLIIQGNGRFDLKVRVPQWATGGFFVKINGKNEKVDANPGSYLSIKRNWKDGDTISLRMPFHFHLEPVMDQQNIASLFYGPVLLAAQEAAPRKDWRKISLNAKDISKSITGDPKNLEFTVDGVLFKPFYESYGRYSVYMDVSLE